MGALCCCCCHSHEDLDYAPQLNRRPFCSHWFWLRCFSSLCPLFFHASQDNDMSQVTSPSQSAGLLDGASRAIPNSDTCGAPPMPFPYDSYASHSMPQLDSIRREKNGTSSLFDRDSVMLHARSPDYVEEKSNVDDFKGNQQQAKMGKDEPSISLFDDEDVCPTCLEGYDEENPKIVTKCAHHFHLGCILDWMERSNSCPVCNKDMVFNESP